jgi:hypothetical protein
VTLIEDDDYMTIKNLVSVIFTYESIKLLDGSYNNVSIRVFELILKFCSAGITICCSFLELIIFEHGLIIEILSIHHKEHLIHIGELTGELSRLEAREGLS